MAELTAADLKGRKSVNAAHLKLQGGGAWLYGLAGIPRLQIYDRTWSRTRQSEKRYLVDGVEMPDLETALDVINGKRRLEDAIPPPPMLAITFWQPWASLIMAGAKPYEFRGASYLDIRVYPGVRPAPGDRVVIHAAARAVKPAEVEDLLKRLGTDADATGLVVDKARPLLERVRAAWRYQALPLGAGLGTVVIGRPRNAGAIFGPRPQSRTSGDFNWAWPLSDVKPFAKPVPARGQQGFWKWQPTKEPT